MALKQNNQPENSGMAMSRKGIKMMIAGLLVMVAGFILLSGGGSDDPNVFNYAMFDFRRLVAAPIVIIAGIVVELLAIMGRFKDN
jgi:formate-dependent nitrite reductase membrane component NrfD